MNAVKHNKIFAITAIALRTTALLCATGPLLQTFLEVLNISSAMNYIHTTILQTANVITIILCAGWADKGNIFKRSMAIHIPMGIMFLFYMPFCIFNKLSALSFAFLLAIGILQSIAIGLNTVCEYKLPYFIYNPREYGIITAISGIVSSGISLSLSSVISILSKYFEYTLIMIFAFIISAAFMISAGILQGYLKSLIDMDSIQKTKKEKLQISKVFRHKAFSHLFLANLFRGFAYGTVTVLAIVAFDIGFDETVTTMMVSIQTVATFAGCILFGFASKHISAKIPIFLGSMSFLLLPLMLIQNKILFLTIYAIIFFGRTLIDYGVPVLLLNVVPVEIAGPYNAWRMILHNSGTLIATTVAALISPTLLFLMTLILQLISGIFFFVLK